MKLGIIGAGGHGKVVGDIALSLNYNQIFYFDDINKSKEIKFLGNYAGKVNKINEYKAIPFIIAIGDNNKRKATFSKFFHRLNIFIYPFKIFPLTNVLTLWCFSINNTITIN